MNLKSIFQVYKNQGPRYFLYRSIYELRRKTGLLKIKFPTNPSPNFTLSLDDWKKSKIPFFFETRETLDFGLNPTAELEQDYQRIIKGEIQFFNREWRKVKDWTTNPESNFQYNIKDHWTKIEDLTQEAGDIKYVWEKSRFSFLYSIIRYDYHFQKDSAEFVMGQISDWIESNPINKGPNYKCSQEISLRCMNWIFALHFYKNSPVLTENLWQKIMHSIYWQVKHVEQNIDFSRICVRNNHAVTETLMLFVAGILFPFFTEAKTWKTNGLKWLQEEIDYQVYDDGTYLQYSHNYQRVLIQLLTWIIRLSELHEVDLAESTKEKSLAVLDYMQHCLVGTEGQMPNYGSNDGALFFNLNDQDYSDFRPQVNALAAVLQNRHFYNESIIQEDAHWFGIVNSDVAVNPDKKGITPFTKGGIYTIKDEDSSFTFMKCARYKDRPAQADNMHLDLWINGRNYLRDSGTYKYNTDDETSRYFAGTMGHNAVMIDDLDQMQKGSRFIWYNWTKDAQTVIQEQHDALILKAEAVMFQEISQNIKHRRIVRKEKSTLTWQINDQIENLSGEHKITQYWHPNPKLANKIQLSATDENGYKLNLEKSTGYWSRYYGQKEEVPLWSFSTETRAIHTTISIIR